MLEELGIGVVQFSPLGRDFLTGAVGAVPVFDKTLFRNVLSRFTSEHHAENPMIVDSLDVLASGIHAMRAQVALGWLLAKKQ
jgi:aryl-alcohol dehydrogenase-like predicted oxidoreductase